MRVVRAFGQLSLSLLLAVHLVGCDGKSSTKKAETASMDCMDKSCPGDTLPARNQATESAFKLKGEWYVGPKEYFSNGIPRGGFEWWDHKPIDSSQKRPHEMQMLAEAGKGYQFSIEVFFRSSNPPISDRSLYEQLINDERDGRVLEKVHIRPGLELWRTQRREGETGRQFYISRASAGLDGFPAVAACDESGLLPRCTTGFLWRPGIWIDLRFHSQHANDWPEIHAEVLRVIQLLRRVKT